MQDQDKTTITAKTEGEVEGQIKGKVQTISDAASRKKKRWTGIVTEGLWAGSGGKRSLH